MHVGLSGGWEVIHATTNEPVKLIASLDATALRETEDRTIKAILRFSLCPQP